MTPFEYLQHQLELEGIAVDGNQLIAPLEPGGAATAPLLIAARVAGGQTVLYFNAALPPEQRRELSASAYELRFPDLTELVSVLAAHGRAARAAHYQTYIFPPSYSQAQAPLVQLLSCDDPCVQAFGFGDFGHAVYAVVRDGAILSACVSSRQNNESAEAWVFTAPAQRGKGLAQQVVAAWARDLLHAGLTPFYSHKVHNQASARLAATLELSPAFEELVLEGEL